MFFFLRLSVRKIMAFEVIFFGPWWTNKYDRFLVEKMTGFWSEKMWVSVKIFHPIWRRNNRPRRAGLFLSGHRGLPEQVPPAF